MRNDNDIVASSLTESLDERDCVQAARLLESIDSLLLSKAPQLTIPKGEICFLDRWHCVGPGVHDETARSSMATPRRKILTADAFGWSERCHPKH